MSKPLVGITMGDAAGIGAEIIIKSLEAGRVYEHCRPLVIGNAKVMRKACEIARVDWKIKEIGDVADAAFNYRTVDVLHCDNIDAGRLRMGEVDADVGRAAVAYTQEAGRLALEGRIDAISSAPLNKAAMRAAGFHYEGATQILAELCGSKSHAMMLILGKLRLIFYSNHLALRDACDAVKKDRLLSIIRLADESLKSMGMSRPRIAVAALNPHGGEGGLFGREEIDEIVPAIAEAEESGIDAHGPIPADSVFVRAREGEFDVAIAMFHDQGAVAMKMAGFGSVVTLLLGLPIIRTSVGHGTAFDIAGKNLADHTNMEEAIVVAADLAASRLRARND